MRENYLLGPSISVSALWSETVCVRRPVILQAVVLYNMLGNGIVAGTWRIKKWVVPASPRCDVCETPLFIHPYSLPQHNILPKCAHSFDSSETPLRQLLQFIEVATLYRPAM